MIKIALVGNIASGKSTAEKILKEKGYSVSDTDVMAHELLNTLADEIITAFNGFDISDSGQISREKLGKIVFNNNLLKSKLENILYPKITAKIEEFFKLHHSEEKVFVAVPLLFEAKMEYLFDKILFIYAEDNIRLKRLIQRNNYSTEYAEKRLKSQLPQEEKVKKSDWVIFNNSTVEDLRKQLSILAE